MTNHAIYQGVSSLNFWQSLVQISLTMEHNLVYIGNRFPILRPFSSNDHRFTHSIVTRIQQHHTQKYKSLTYIIWQLNSGLKNHSPLITPSSNHNQGQFTTQLINLKICIQNNFFVKIIVQVFVPKRIPFSWFHTHTYFFSSPNSYSNCFLTCADYQQLWPLAFQFYFFRSPLAYGLTCLVKYFFLFFFVPI